MKKRNIIIISLVFAAIISTVIIYQYINRSNMIDCVVTWGRFAEFPTEIQDFKIKTEGGMFTRAFRASFSASPEIISEWLFASPGISDSEKEIISPNRIRYLIKPGGGAQHAEVDVDQEKCIVKIYVYWS